MVQDSGNVIVYVDDNGKPQVDVRFQDETVWLTQAQLVDLYQSSKANVSEHIKNIFDEGELDPAATVQKFRTVRTEGDRQVERELEYYNLDMIISLGYRIKSNIATKFRIWATDRLREYIVKSFKFFSDFRIALDSAINMLVLTFVYMFVSIISASPRVGSSSAGLFIVMEGYNA
jgi:hypothetical protein